MPSRTLVRPTRRQVRPRRLTQRAVKKRETRERILKSADKIARREGLRAASVPRVMKGAGLTIGGFYAHFSSKTAMDVEVIGSMLGDVPGPWLSGLEDFSGLGWVQEALERYLSVTHRDQQDGCAYPAVLSEMVGAPDEVRQAFAESFLLRVGAFQAHVPPLAGFTARERALATLALAIGGLLFSRALRGSRMSDDMLHACRKWALPELDADPPTAER
jgi:TetR/AcrR family transcriptional regulator, transcriptional repressor for nem operon